MTPELQRRVLDALDDALGWPEAERQARLASLDPEVAAGVAALLKAEDAGRRHWPTRPPEPSTAAAEAPPPERIGPWRLTRLLGRGGMGAVWLGERDDGLFDQAVAVKLMRPGLFSAAAGEQFSTERRLLARLRHPNIARLYDGGLDVEGRSYIVMEVVDGLPITDFADAKGLGWRERLGLLLKVCDAVQHAHGALVVHADIKPGNVLVEPDGTPKLLDFGIARGLSESVASAESQAGHGLTDAYASPQRRAGEPPIPADDLYALGMLLAELLAGRDSRGAPSVGRIADPDLRAIAGWATADDPAARYPAASALAEDLRRRLEGRPVRARPARRGRAFALFARRHPLASLATAAAVLSLVLGLAVIAGLYVHAEQQRQAAETRFVQVRGLARFMLFDLSDQLQAVPGGAALRRETADVGRRYLQQLAAVPNASVDLQLETAAGYGRVGHAMAVSSVQNTGEAEAGERALAQAERMLRALHAADPGRTDVIVELARVMAWRAGVVASVRGDSAAAERLTDEALRLLERVPPGDAQTTAAGHARWNAELGLADLWTAAGRDADVARLMAAAHVRGGRLPVTPEVAALRPLLEATTRIKWGDAIYESAGPATALPHYLAAVATLERAAAASESVDVRVTDRLIVALWDVSSTYADLDRPLESLAWADRGVAAARQLTAFDRSPRSQRVASMVELQRASALSRLGRHDDAVAQGLEAVERRQAMARADPLDADLGRAAASSWRPLAETYARAGRTSEACATARRSRDAWAELERRGLMTAFDRTNDLTFTLRMLRDC